MLKHKLKTLRQQTGVSQAELAQAIGVDQSSVGKYEGAAQVIPSAEVLVRIADYFGVSVDYLLGRTMYPTPSEQINDDPELTEYLHHLANRKEMRMLFKTTKNTTKADVEEAVRIIEAIRNRPEYDE